LPCTLRVLRGTSCAVCCALYVARCMLRVGRCMFHAKLSVVCRSAAAALKSVDQRRRVSPTVLKQYARSRARGPAGSSPAGCTLNATTLTMPFFADSPFFPNTSTGPLRSVLFCLPGPAPAIPRGALHAGCVVRHAARVMLLATGMDSRAQPGHTIYAQRAKHNVQHTQQRYRMQQRGRRCGGGGCSALELRTKMKSRQAVYEAAGLGTQARASFPWSVTVWSATMPTPRVSERSPGAGVAGVSPVPVLMWQGWAQSWSRCGMVGRIRIRPMAT
jgi:hypothetical protein